MRLRPKHSQFIASKIARDLANSTFITLPKGKDRVVEVTKMVIDENLEREKKLDAKVKELMEANEEEIRNSACKGERAILYDKEETCSRV